MIVANHPFKVIICKIVLVSFGKFFTMFSTWHFPISVWATLINGTTTNVLLCALQKNNSYDSNPIRDCYEQHCVGYI